MKPYYQGELATIYHGECQDILTQLPYSASAIVTDPPYELGFMGKSWDSRGVSFQPWTWETVRRVCRPGAMMLCFGGTRTFHRIACAIEDAGWELRDTIMWLYGSGFPKSLDISKAIDKQGGNSHLSAQVAKALREARTKRGITIAQADSMFCGGTTNYSWFEGRPAGQRIPSGAIFSSIADSWPELDDLRIKVAEREREIIGRGVSGIGTAIKNGQWSGLPSEEFDITIPATPEAQLWNGYGTALKPAYEPILVCMNPLDRTFAHNALEHGVAGLNIDECRVPTTGSGQGRFPANIIHDGSPEVMELFPDTKSGKPGIKHTGNTGAAYGSESRPPGTQMDGFGDSGSAARFFYCAKASKSERNKGCEDLEIRKGSDTYRPNDTGDAGIQSRLHGATVKGTNNHPTVKPLALMSYLCTLVCYPQHNLIIDPFCGSGSTLVACISLHIPCIGIDNDEHSCEIAAHRCEAESAPETAP